MTGQVLTPHQAARLQQAYTFLQQGLASDAAAAARAVCREAKRSPDAYHLLALSLAAAGDSAGAEEAFAKARKYGPDAAQIAGNYANFLTRLGRFDDAMKAYRGATARFPDQVDLWLNYGLACLKAGETPYALAALEKAVTLKPDAPLVWQALGNARRNNNDYSGAETAFRRSLSLDPSNGLAWLNLGVILRLLGDPDSALDCYASARKTGFATPELFDAEASAKLDRGDFAVALEEARALTASAPRYAPGHVMLAHLLWEHGDRLSPGEDPFTSFKAAAELQPDNHDLQIALANLLIEASRLDEALALIRRLRTREDGPALIAAEANALEIMERHDDASVLFEEAYPHFRKHPAFLNIFTRHLLKRRRNPERAALIAQETTKIAPNDQEAWAFLSTAWRLLEDEREFWLCDYERLIGYVDVEPPEGGADREDFIDALKGTLIPMHQAVRAPVNQSLRDGSQTSGSLFGRQDPVIAATRQAIVSAVESHIASLPDDPDHPFLRRKESSVQFTGSWSVRLWRSGRHVNHYHPKGWMSSAFYVGLPPSVIEGAAPDDRSGWIQFGEPPLDLGLNLAPRRAIRPEIGRLALFPSFMWHGTVPFDDDAPRLTTAFDMVPWRRPA